MDYWVGRVIGSHDVSGYLVNDEIDEVDWVGVDKAQQRLSYDAIARPSARRSRTGKKTRALVVLRHGQARSRKAWHKDDRKRPLLVGGNAQARAPPACSRRTASPGSSRSSSTRCADTVAPYAERSGWPMTSTDSSPEEDATAKSVLRIVDELLHSGEDAVLCTHRPVLPAVYDALGIPPEPQATGELVVVHHRRGRVRAIERHLG